jgi:hypothetical protein
VLRLCHTFSTTTGRAGDWVGLTLGAALSMLVEGVRLGVTLTEGPDVGLAVAEAVPGRAVRPMLTMLTPPLPTRICGVERAAISQPERSTSITDFKLVQTRESGSRTRTREPDLSGRCG